MKADDNGAYPSIAVAAAGTANTALAGSSGIWHYWRRRMPVEPSVLTDKTLFPSEDLIFSHIGRQRAQWEALFRFIHAEHPDFVAAWRYYNDGKSWLMNVSRKKKTVFWLSVIRGTFRITGYFTDKAADAIRASALSDERKQQFMSGPRYGKLGAITITFRKKLDVEDAKVLVALKTS
jgi:hypothetical protein